MQPSTSLSLLSHEIRLRFVLVLLDQPELCVSDSYGGDRCTPAQRIASSGPVACAGLVADRRDGQWIHYRLNGDLPERVMAVLEATAQAVLDTAPYKGHREAVAAMLAHGDTRRCR